MKTTGFIGKAILSLALAVSPLTVFAEEDVPEEPVSETAEETEQVSEDNEMTEQTPSEGNEVVSDEPSEDTEEDTDTETIDSFDSEAESEAPEEPASEEKLETNDEVSEELFEASPAEQYSYEVTPLLPPFNAFIYVKTTNPDPASFQLVDRDSKYFTETKTEGVYEQSKRLYADVLFEDTSTYRVKDGYIFVNRNVTSDGGNLILQIKENSTYTDTNVIIQCPDLIDETDYMVQTYTSSDKDLFANLNSVQSALRRIAVYPLSTLDSSSPNETQPYPFLAASPYEELSLNEHYTSMYGRYSGSVLLHQMYPFVLDSLGFPGLIGSVAKRLDPDCTVSRGSIHSEVIVSKGDTKRTYGGAGEGEGNAIMSDQIAKRYLFDGSDGDYANKETLEAMYNLLLQHEETANANAAPYRDLIAGATFKETIGNGTWIRVVVEGSGSTAYSYEIRSASGSTYPISNAWVDGRYIGNNEIFLPGEKFEDHPTSRIVIPNYTYQNAKGETVTKDVIFNYNSSSDTWKASFTYYGSYYDELPDSLILTREEVEAMQVDRNTDYYPDTGLIYDGTEYPGTPFSVEHLQGITVPEKLTVYVDDYVEIPVTFHPENATETAVRYSSSDNDTVFVSSYNSTYYSHDKVRVRGKKAGTAIITIETFEGGASAQCEVTVLPLPVVSGTVESWSDIGGEVKIGLYRTNYDDYYIRNGYLKPIYDCEITTSQSGVNNVYSFAFKDVKFGSYKLGILREGKYAPAIMTIEVTEDLDVGKILLHLYGDVNFDGEVNTRDSQQILRYYAGKTSVFDLGTAEEKEARIRAADVTSIRQSGQSITPVIDTRDSQQILRYYAGKSSVIDYAN